jgi:prevent-host-death family protein
METVSCREVKDNMAEILNRVAYNHKRYKIARHNKGVAIIISVEEWEAIEKILQNIEDQEDVNESLLALKEIEKQGSVSFEEMKKRVGL